MKFGLSFSEEESVSRSVHRFEDEVPMMIVYIHENTNREGQRITRQIIRLNKCEVNKLASSKRMK